MTLHYMMWNKIDLIDDAARLPHMALYHLIVGETGTLERSPAFLVRAILAMPEPVTHTTVEGQPDPDGNVNTINTYWLTEPQCVALIASQARPNELASMTAALTDGFRRAAHKITLKKEKVAEKAARPRTVSTAIADAAERLKCSTSTIYTATRTLYGSSKTMTPDDAQTAIEWLDALTEKPSSKKG